MTKRTASTSYEAHRREIDTRIERLKELLAAFDRKQAADPLNWGYAGSAEHIKDELSNINAFLTDEEG
jgi:hypothetical protein